MSYGIIYCITNKLNGKQYVGLTTRGIQERYTEHSKTDSYVGRAIRKYGQDNFTVSQLDVARSPEELAEKEIYWIDKLNTYEKGYNQTLGGDGVSVIERLEITLTKHQERYIKYADKRNREPIDVNNHVSMIESVLINLVHVYLLADRVDDKRKAAQTIENLKTEYKQKIIDLGIINFRELMSYV